MMVEKIIYQKNYFMKVSKKESSKKRKIKYWNRDSKKIIAEKKNIQKI